MEGRPIWAYIPVKVGESASRTRSTMGLICRMGRFLGTSPVNRGPMSGQSPGLEVFAFAETAYFSWNALRRGRIDTKWVFRPRRERSRTPYSSGD